MRTIQKNALSILAETIAGFWKKWTTEYLTQLPSRSKNMAEKQKLTKGDLAYITDVNSPHLSCPLGIVHETYTGKANLVRVAKIKTGNGKFSSRPIVKLRRVPITVNWTLTSRTSHGLKLVKMIFLLI